PSYQPFLKILRNEAIKLDGWLAKVAEESSICQEHIIMGINVWRRTGICAAGFTEGLNDSLSNSIGLESGTANRHADREKVTSIPRSAANRVGRARQARLHPLSHQLAKFIVDQSGM